MTAAAALALVALGACSTTSGSSAPAPEGSADAAARTTGSAPSAQDPAHTCDRPPAVAAPEVSPVDGSPDDRDLTSFDGTVIRMHWYPAPGGSPSPTVLNGPGWSQPGATKSTGDVTGLSLSPIGELNDAGYNVLTWDPRGFGASGGAAMVDDPEHEGRDMQVVLDWLATQPEVQLDAPGDPRLGMVGGSYGGGIQFVLAGIDCRVDAIVPTIAWHSLVTSLYPNETVKSGWGGILAQAGESLGTLDPHITAASGTGFTTGVLDTDSVQWFEARGPGDLVSKIEIPTLIVQGTTDTLFTLSESVQNFEALQAAGTRVSLLWVCDGHGVCLTDRGDPDVIPTRTRAWLDRYLKGADADTGPTVQLLDQDGRYWVGDDYPEPDGRLEADGAGGTLALTADSAAGPATVPPDAGRLSSLVAPVTPARAVSAIELVLTADREALAVGAPHVRVDYHGTAPDGVEPTRLFAQLVDDQTGLVLGNQITPVPVVLDGQDHTVDLDLELVAHHLQPGRSVTLQLVATTPAFATPRLGGTIAVTDLHLELPTTTALTPVGG